MGTLSDVWGTTYYHCCNANPAGVGHTGVGLPLQFALVPLQWTSVSLGSDKVLTEGACRGSYVGNDPSWYDVKTGVASIWDCQALCANASSCSGIEYSSDYDSGRCELWKVSLDWYGSGPLEAVYSPGFTCLTYNEQGVPFQPIDGGLDRACRASGGLDGDQYYELREGIATIFDCESSCVDMANCVGIEYHANGRCELWKVSPLSLTGNNNNTLMG